MRVRQDLHTHTCWDDGTAAPEDMARAGLEAGLNSMGFSVHSPLPWSNDWTLPVEKLALWHAQAARVRRQFQEQITLYDGLEWDSVSPPVPEGFDYVIGSVHLLPPGEEESSVDESAACTAALLRERYGGDEKAMARTYFERVVALGSNPRVDIIGHVDLVCKFCQQEPLFDSRASWLQELAFPALETLTKAGKIFEVNTGAMARGYRTEPYPSLALLRRLRELGGRVLLSSDAHSPGTVAFAFREMEELLKDLGFREIWIYDGRSFVPAPL